MGHKGCVRRQCTDLVDGTCQFKSISCKYSVPFYLFALKGESMWINKKEKKVLDDRIAELERELKNRIYNLESKMNVEGQMIVGKTQNDLGYNIEHCQPVKKVICAILEHFNLEIQHEQAKEVLNLKEKQPEMEENKSKSAELGPMWVKENLDKAKADLNRNVRGYNSLKNKDTKYAKGILRIIKAKEKVVAIWQEA